MEITALGSHNSRLPELLVTILPRFARAGTFSVFNALVFYCALTHVVVPAPFSL